MSDHKQLHVTNNHGTFVINIGDQIACYPFREQYNTVIGLFDHNDPRVIVISTANNQYDTRLSTDVCNVR